MELLPIVLYTYGGFHDSTNKFIKSLVDSLDPATSLVSRLEFKQALKQHIAIAIQRGNADVMIKGSQQQRASKPLHKFIKQIFNPQQSTLPRPSPMDAVVPMSPSGRELAGASAD